MNPLLLHMGAIDARLATDCRLLKLEKYAIKVRIGVHDFERLAPQRMWFDVALCVRLSEAPAAQDDIGQTLNYDFIRTAIQEIVGDTHHELQETLCDAMLARLLDHPQVQAAFVSTRKPDVYPDSESVGTERFQCKPWTESTAS